MNKRRLTDEEMTKKVSELVDNIVNSGKENTRTLLELLVEKTAQTTGDIFDKSIEQFKQHLKKRLFSDDKKQNKST